MFVFDETKIKDSKIQRIESSSNFLQEDSLEYSFWITATLGERESS